MIDSLVFVAFALQAVLQVQAVNPDTDLPRRSAATPGGNLIPDADSRDLLSIAANEFDQGMMFSHDAVKARPRFREASRIYDELWQRGVRDPNLALNRANSAAWLESCERHCRPE